MPAVTIHNLQQAQCVLAHGNDVALVAPAYAVRILGAGFFAEIANQIGAEILIDCGDLHIEALNAIDLRCPAIRAACRPDIQGQLLSLCAQTGLNLTADLPSPLIKLDWDDEEAVILTKIG